MKTAPFSCPACEATLTDACLQAVPAPLCGLCHLVTLDHLARYLARWNPAVADLEAGDRRDAA